MKTEKINFPKQLFYRSVKRFERRKNYLNIFVLYQKQRRKDRKKEKLKKFYKEKIHIM